MNETFIPEVVTTGQLGGGTSSIHIGVGPPSLESWLLSSPMVNSLSYNVSGLQSSGVLRAYSVDYRGSI